MLYKHEARSEKRQVKRLAARFVNHVSIPDGTELPANVPFTKIWRFRNEGEVAWPPGCYLTFISWREGDLMGAQENVMLGGVPEVGEEIDVTVEMVSPPKVGYYVGFWKLSTPFGRKFGQRVWVKINVKGDGNDTSATQTPAEDSQEKERPTMASQLAELRDRGFTTDIPLQISLLRKHGGDLDRVVQELMRSK